MIRRFRDKEARGIFEGEPSRRLPPDVQRAAYRKLKMLDAATSLADLLPLGVRERFRRGDRRLPLDENAMKKRLDPVHPGEILLEEFMKPRGITQYRVAKDIHVPPRRINEIVRGMRAVSADSALRLGRYFGVAPQFWLNLQAGYDLEIEGKKLKSRLEREVLVLPPADAASR